MCVPVWLAATPLIYNLLCAVVSAVLLCLQVRTHLRNMVIIPEMIGSVVGVYNGKTFNQVEIKPDMIGHYLAEFSIRWVGGGCYHPRCACCAGPPAVPAVRSGVGGWVGGSTMCLPCLLWSVVERSGTSRVPGDVRLCGFSSG